MRMTENNKKIQKPGFFQNKNALNLVTFLVILMLATAMACRKQFVLDFALDMQGDPPLYIFLTTLGTSDNTYEQNNPLYSSKIYLPPSFKIPLALFSSAWFHVFSVIAFWFLTTGGVFLLIRMGGFTIYQSIVLTFFTLFVGNLIIRELFNIPLLGPAPYVGYTKYNFRTPVIPLSVLATIAMFKRHFLVSGLLTGLATLCHIKFGFRFYGLLLFSLLLWKFWGSKRVDFEQEDLSWRNIIIFSMGWGVLFIATFWDIWLGLHFFDSFNLPQSQPLISELAWLIKNEPDDWLVSYYFYSGRPFWGFLFMAVSTGAFCEIIIRLSNVSSWKKFAVVWQIATLAAVVFFGLGFLFESFLIDWLPLKAAHSIALTRFWDLIWVVVIGFWITLISVAVTVLERIMARLEKPKLISSNVFFHFAMALFLCINLAVFIIKKDGELVKVFGLKAIPVLKIIDYIQICDKTSDDYNEVYQNATMAIREKDEKGFQAALSKLNAVYNEFKVKLDNPPLQNLDSVNLNILNHLINGRYAKAIKETARLHHSKMIREQDTYLWSCLHSEPGIHHRSFNIPTRDYLDAAKWVKDNIPSGEGIIQPPYLGGFAMYSEHVSFWDSKFDQHAMYTIKGYYRHSLHRLKSVAGPDAWELESGAKVKGLGPTGRWYFLDLTKERIMKIHRDYPGYNYLLTENKNLQGYPAVYSNPSLTLYNISGS